MRALGFDVTLHRTIAFGIGALVAAELSVLAAHAADGCQVAVDEHE